MVAQGEHPATLAARLDRLFKSVRPGGQREYTYEEVAAAIRENGISISHTYVWQLRKGMRDNPTKRHLEGLAQFFGVPTSYFLDDNSGIEDQLELLVALRDSDVRSLALRASGLSPASIKAVLGMVQHARSIEGLPPAEDDGDA
ncbi:XRE family transcriptional regulator [Lentzea sp. NPDC003310]|uniref:XRE family transcriptional regulator n=1 Tax=Lentzea sp. NPDC003310 TaxID=3154447 RepID=UPI0033A4F169